MAEDGQRGLLFKEILIKINNPVKSLYNFYSKRFIISMKQKIVLKRAYDPASPEDGYRVYIDKLWPRGLSHETFHYDFWDKAIAPSSQLREWFHQDAVGRWNEFQQKYKLELLSNPSFKNLKKEIEDKPIVTLLYSSRDHDHNNAVVVKNILETV